jgi:hypothetical protein
MSDMEYRRFGSLAVSGSTIIAGTTGTAVYRSTDNGDSWTPIVSGLGNVMVYALATDGTSVVLSGDMGIYRSTIDGTPWVRVERSDLQFSVVSLAVSGSDFFAATTSNHRVLHSSDGGLTWSDIGEGLPTTSLMGLAAGGTNLFVGTMGHSVWRRPLAQIPVGVQHEPLPQLSSSAVQVHPNPVVFSGTVRYRLDARASVSITINDALGRVVAQPVVDAVQEAGEHEIALPTDDLTAGVYLCSVNAGGVEQTVRFVVVR